MNKPLIVLPLVLLGLAGCGQKPTQETTAPPAAATAPPAAAPAETGVTRSEPAAPAVPAAPAKAALDTQTGPQGTQAALTKALVRGDILTVELQYSLPASADNMTPFYEKVEQISYVDDATSKKYGVLKDQTQAFMATPFDTDLKKLRVAPVKAGPAIVTLKFPAPPATSKTISLSIPETGSFDGIAVQR